MFLKRTFLSALLIPILILLVSSCGSAEKPPKLLVLGLDGGTFKLIEPWLEAGLLPNLQELRESGVSGPLTSVIPPLSPPAWTTAVTGVNPGAHGIFDFFWIDQDSLSVFQQSAEARRVPALWTLMSEAGYKVGILNVPMSDPPDPVEGFMVSGFPHADSTDFTYPPELERDLLRHGYRLDRMGTALIPGREHELRDEVMSVLEERRKAALRLLGENPDLDLYWAVFTATDRAQHFFWKFMEKEHPFYDPELAKEYGNVIRDVWIRTDAAVGELVALAREQAEAEGRELAVIALSDHGFGPVHRAFRPQSLIKNPPDGKKPIDNVYCLETNASMLFVPVHGREKNAPYTQEEQTELVEDVYERITAAIDPKTGETPLLFAAHGREVYRGRYADRAPDLVFLPKPTYYFINEEGNKEPFGVPEFSFNGHHEMDGILIACGPMFRKGEIEGRQSLYDVSPTVMHLAGMEVPGYMEGKALTALLTREFNDAHPVRTDDSEARETGADAERIKTIPYVQ